MDRTFSAPGRTELAGNHTDHNCGKVLAAAIQLENKAVVQKRDDDIVLFRSAGFSDVTVNLQELDFKPQETGTTEALVRGIAAELKKRGRRIGGFTADATSTVLPGSGLSSSAALEILLCRIFDGLFNELCPQNQALSLKSSSVSKMDPVEMAQIGQIAENVYFGKPCGLMDQLACSISGAIAIDFKDPKKPIIKKLNFDLAAAGYALCVVNTGGSHANLTADYAAIPQEMKAVAAFFGKSVLRELDKQTVLDNATDVRKKLGDRALLRALHFFDENDRVDTMIKALSPNTALSPYIELINESGDSSWQLLQNVYSPQNPQEQGISAALSLTKDFFKGQSLNRSNAACRVHGGGFAGTIQAYVPLDIFTKYKSYIEAVFGDRAVTQLQIG